MSHIAGGHEYATNRVFNQEELNTVKPDHIYKWMCLKVYGMEDPGIDDNPVGGRSSSTLRYWKKAIFYFMTNTAASDETNETGNPTRSININQLIKAVAKKETRQLGVKTSADRAFTHEEFAQMLDLTAIGDSLQSLRYMAMLQVQLHLIARGDDTSHMKKANLQVSSTYAGYLTIQMKNVHDEGDCPLQLVMGAMDYRYCVLIGLAIYLEAWLGNSRSPLKAQNKEADKCKTAYQKALKAVIEGNQFRPLGRQQRLGTHSVKKARWKTKSMQDWYLDAQLDWPDINAGSKLFYRGICLYKEKDDSGLIDDWLCASVAPAIRGAFGDNAAAILAKPLLWACFDPAAADYIPLGLKQQIVRQYELLQGRLEDGVNPICRAEVGEEGDGRGAFGRGGQQWRNAIYAKLSTTQTNVAEMRNHQISELAELRRQIKILTQMVQGLTLAPAQRTIQALWDEYQNGIGGRKLAREFAAVERRRVKYKYCNHKVLWRCMERLPDRGNDVNTAVAKIKRCYGDCTMTQLIWKMRPDERQGGNFQLR
eukprot:jgi/Psemu1/182624/e_gw1.27.224.1